MSSPQSYNYSLIKISDNQDNMIKNIDELK